MKVCEIFESIREDGKLIGMPTLFVRLSGCTRNCNWCYVKYHTKSKEIKIDDLVKILSESKLDICWTGGEPMLQYTEISEIIKMLRHKKEFFLETNGDWVPVYPTDKEFVEEIVCYFDDIVISPKEPKVIDNILSWKILNNADIKIVTDLKNIGIDVLQYAMRDEPLRYISVVAPLISFDDNKDKQVIRNVWKWCIDNNIKFTVNMASMIWGKRNYKKILWRASK